MGSSFYIQIISHFSHIGSDLYGLLINYLIFLCTIGMNIYEYSYTHHYCCYLWR